MASGPHGLDVLQLASEGRAEELRDQLRERALRSVYYFSKVVCGYAQLSPNFHMPLCLDLQNSIKIKKRGYLWPRGHFKSTIITKSYNHWRLCGGGKLEEVPEILELETADLLAFYKEFPDKDPRNTRIAIVGESQDVANKNLKDIKDRTLENELFRWLFPELVPPDPGKVKWTESEIVLPRSKSFDESSITCMGVGAKKTGFHFDLINYDDVIGLEASQSEPVMESALEWIKYAPGMLHDKRYSEEIMAGTRWKDGKADVYGWLMATLPYRPDLDPPQGFKFSVRSCYNADGSVAFAERFTREDLEETRTREGDYKFNCQYRNTPTPPEGSKFNGYKFFSVENDGDGEPRIAVPHDNSGPIHINQMGRISFYDPSSGGPTANAENAIVVVGTDSQSRHFVIDVWSANCGYSAAIEHWHHLNDKYVCWFNGYEQVGNQKEIEEIITLRNMYGGKCRFCELYHRRLAPQGVKPPANTHKHTRMELFLEPAIKEGRLYVQQKHVELCRQLDMFPNGDLVDIADALAHGVKVSKPFVGFEEEMDRRGQVNDALMARHPRIKTEHSYGGYI